MRIEALARLKITLSGGAIRELEPGQPIDLLQDDAMKLSARASGKVWVIPAGDDWLSRWHAIAVVTAGIRRTDARFSSVVEIIEDLDAHYRRNDLTAFKKALPELRDAVKGQNH